LKLRRAAIIIAGTAVLGLGALLFGGHMKRVAAERLLRAAYADGTQVGFAGEADIGLLVDGKWTERRARIRQANGRRRIEGPNGPAGAALLDDGKTLWRLEPATNTATGLSPSERRRNWQLLLGNYRLRPEGEAQVAGRRARRLALISRRGRRAALRLWIDPETKVALRTDSFDADGRLVARTILDSVDFSRPPHKDVLRVPEGWRRTWAGDSPAEKLSIEQFAAKADFTPRPPSYIPRGYAHDGLYGRTCPHGRRYAEFRYRDGLRTLSLFERHPRGPHGRGRGRGMGWRGGRGWQMDREPAVIDQGATKSIRQRKADLMLIVTGDLPVAELLRVLESVPEE